MHHVWTWYAYARKIRISYGWIWDILSEFCWKIADFELNTRTREKFCYENCFGIFRILSREGWDLDDEILSQKTGKNKRKCQKMWFFWAFSWKMVKYFISILSWFWAQFDLNSFWLDFIKLKAIGHELVKNSYFSEFWQ